jgi:hypothetical protein
MWYYRQKMKKETRVGTLYRRRAEGRGGYKFKNGRMEFLTLGPDPGSDKSYCMHTLAGAWAGGDRKKRR